jgi:hypothetical protein
MAAHPEPSPLAFDLQSQGCRAINTRGKNVCVCAVESLFRTSVIAQDFLLLPSGIQTTASFRCSAHIKQNLPRVKRKA